MADVKYVPSVVTTNRLRTGYLIVIMAFSDEPIWVRGPEGYLCASSEVPVDGGLAWAWYRRAESMEDPLPILTLQRLPDRFAAHMHFLPIPEGQPT